MNLGHDCLCLSLLQPTLDRLCDKGFVYWEIIYRTLQVYDYYYDPYYYRYKYWYPSYLDYDYSIYPYTSRYLARIEADEDLRRARRLRYLDLVERENLRASLRAKELNRR